MAEDAYIGEIRLFCMEWAPEGWLPCDGAELAISQYQALYSIIENTYGGVANRTFKLPDLRGKAVMSCAPNSQDPKLGFSEGQETVTLTLEQLPSHNHSPEAAILPTGTPAAGNAVAVPVKGARISRLITSVPSVLQAKTYTAYKAASAPVPLAPATIGPIGGGGSHENRQPYLVFNFCICVDGEYPVPAP